MLKGDRRIPNLFIVGAPKCGTTAFASGLAQHPDIYVGKKEPRYFDAPVFYDDPRDYPIKTLEDYLSLYESEYAKSARYRLDASVFNMYHPSGIKKILELEPNAIFIVILRDPVQAAQSMHSQRLKSTSKAMREVSENFLSCWNLMEKRREGRGFPKGCKNRTLFRYDYLYDYKSHLRNLMGLIPKNQLLLVDYEAFKFDSHCVFKKIFNHLGLKEIEIKIKVKNSSYSTKMTYRNRMIDSFRRFLVKLPFRPRRLVVIANKIIDIAIEKAEVKKLEDQDVVEVESFFEPSREAMKSALNKHGVKKY